MIRCGDGGVEVRGADRFSPRGVGEEEEGEEEETSALIRSDPAPLPLPPPRFNAICWLKALLKEEEEEEEDFLGGNALKRLEP